MRGASICFGIIAFAACDPLVGGICAPGYLANDEGACVTQDSLLDEDDDGDAGGAATTSTGGGGATGTGGATGVGGSAGGGGNTGGSGGSGGPLFCPVGETRCGRSCVDTDANAIHCGKCFNACATGLCSDGSCIGGDVGHVVVIGMSYASSTAASRSLLGNAVFLTSHEPARVLAYTEYGITSQVNTAHTIIAQQATQRGRSVAIASAANAATVNNQLSVLDSDVLLVHDQALAASSGMSNIGLAMSGVLASFAHDGGIIVVLATTDPPMSAFLSSTGLLVNTGLVPVSGSQLSNHEPGSAVGLGVPSPFLASNVTAGILTSMTPDPWLTFVMSSDAGGGLPVVVHRIVDP